MIVSHKHKYVFIALPRTASNAVSKELMECYAGEQILSHHSLYRDFLHSANESEKDYRSFIAVRNPLDSAVSAYFKYRTAHHDIYSNPKVTKVGRMRRYVRYFTDTRRYRFVTDNEVSFDDFFLRFYHLPYADWSMLDREKFTYIIRYENLQEDFSKVINDLGIDQIRPLPMRNKTSKKTSGFLEMYKQPETIIRAKSVFGPFMKIWGYEFPSEWDSYPESKISKSIFPVVSGFYSLYWKYLR
ncbi:MAG: sulfotransferase family 2 domain-containing protein [Methylococcales bacterium]